MGVGPSSGAANNSPVRGGPEFLSHLCWKLDEFDLVPVTTTSVEFLSVTVRPDESISRGHLFSVLWLLTRLCIDSTPHVGCRYLHLEGSLGI